MSIVAEPKKRGRKPKNVVSNDVNEDQEDNLDVNKLNNNIIIEDATPKKRGRKPKNQLLDSSGDNYTPTKKSKSNLDDALVVYKFETDDKPDIANEQFDKQKDSIIVKLPLNTDTVNKVINQTNNNMILESNSENSNWYSNIDEVKPKESEINELYENFIENRKNDFDISKSKTVNIRKPVDYTMAQFNECNKKKTWPQRTNIYCFNCCHPFDHTPSALPFKYQNGIFHVYGCFCYPECAAAFNFTDLISLENANENYNLLNLMYKIAYNDPLYRVKIPGHRTCLKIFGGHLDINAYRDSFNNNNIYQNIIMPPVMSILPIQEENNIIYYKKNVQATINNNNKGYDGANRREKEITLKRSKPLINKQNTLDSCMNITVSA